MCKSLQWNHLPFHLSIEHFYVISVANKSEDHGKLLFICLKENKTDHAISMGIQVEK